MRHSSQTPRSPWRRLRPVLLQTGVLLSALLGSAQAQITLDGSLGPSGPLPGPAYVIPAAVGQTRGPNLFHSFGQFNVHTGEQATFTGPSTIANIVSRITGGQASTIDGLLRSEIAGASLFLLNPQGMLFGPNAQLDVAGSVHVSTADVLRFADGYAFQAHNQPEPLLTMAAPAAFGFTGAQAPAALHLHGSRLTVPAGATLAVVGGEVRVQGGRLRAPGGEVRLVSAGDAGEVAVVGSAAVGGLQGGPMTVTEGAEVDVSGATGGRVRVQGGQVEIKGARLVADTSGAEAGGGVEVVVDALALRAGGQISASARSGSRGAAGAIRVTATDQVLIAGGTQGRPSGLFSTTEGEGHAGTVMVETPRLTLRNFGQISTSAGTIETNRANAQQGTIDATGDAGTVTITATERVTIEANNSRNRSHTGLFSNTHSRGNAGQIMVTTGTLTMEGGRILSSSNGVPGAAGQIALTVARLEMGDASLIRTNADDLLDASERDTVLRVGSGDVGMITVRATDGVTIRGEESLSALVARNRGNEGAPGRITVEAPRLEITGRGEIRTETGGSCTWALRVIQMDLSGAGRVV